MVGAVERVRPGPGSEVMQRIAVPMIGGMVSSTILTLAVIPAVYGVVKGRRLPSPGASTKADHFNAAQHAYNGEQR